MRNNGSRIPAIYAAHRSTRVSTRLPDNDLDEQRCLLMQLNITERRNLFLEPRTLQATSPNFVFYCRYTGKVVEFPMPVYTIAGQERVSADKFKDYHAYRRQNYECWCGLCSPEVPCWVEIYKRNGRWYYSCDICGLHVCIDNVYESATMTAVYPGYPRASAVLSVPSDPLTVQGSLRRRLNGPTRSGPLGIGAHRKRSTMSLLHSNPKTLLTPPRAPTTTSSASLESPVSPYAILRRFIPNLKAAGNSKTINYSPLPSPSSSVLKGCIRGPTPDASNVAEQFNDVRVQCERCDRYIPFETFESHCRWCRVISPEL